MCKRFGKLRWCCRRVTVLDEHVLDGSLKFSSVEQTVN